MAESEKTGPGKGTHWSNLISILGVGGKKVAETPPSAPEAPPSPPEVEIPAPLAETAAGDDPLQLGWGKPAAKKRTAESKAAPARKPAAPPAAAKPAAKAPANPKVKHWGSLAEQLGLPAQEIESSVADEPTWIEESEQNGNLLSGDDAADECVSHAGGPTCAPQDCENRSESCAMRPPQTEEVIDTRDTEFLDDVPATDEDLDALADMINEGMPASDFGRRGPRREDDEEEMERPRSGESREIREPRGEGRGEGRGELREEGRGEGEDGTRRRRRRRGRGRGRRDEGGEDRRPARDESARDLPPRAPVARDVEADDRYSDFDDRPASRREEHDEDLDRDSRARDSDDDSDVIREGEGRRAPRDESSDDQERRPRRRRRRRRGSEESTEASRGPRREAEPTDRVRSADPSYRRKEEPADFDDEGDGDEPVAVHRNLPTWEDALSAIIAGNIENRARTPQQHYGGRGRGGGGRDRGGNRGGDRGGDRGDRGGDRGGRDRDRGSDRGPPRGRRDDRGDRR